MQGIGKINTVGSVKAAKDSVIYEKLNFNLFKLNRKRYGQANAAFIADFRTNYLHQYLAKEIVKPDGTVLYPAKHTFGRVEYLRAKEIDSFRKSVMALKSRQLKLLQDIRNIEQELDSSPPQMEKIRDRLFELETVDLKKDLQEIESMEKIVKAFGEMHKPK